MRVSRSRQRLAIAALLAAVPGIQSAYPYPQDEQTPSLRGTTFAEVDFTGLKEQPLSSNEKRQDVVWRVRLVTWTRTAIKTGDNASRQALIDQFEALMDSVEDVLRANYKLLDSLGAGNPVAMSFGSKFESIGPITDWAGDGSKLEALIYPEGIVIQ